MAQKTKQKKKRKAETPIKHVQNFQKICEEPQLCNQRFLRIYDTEDLYLSI